MPFKIVRNDITKMQVDAVVNTANEAPIYSTGVDAAIYKAAGEEELLAARRQIGYMKEGEVAITDGYRLPAKYIIHAVSPLYIDGESGEEEKLRMCYRRSLRLAYENQCKSIAFPLIATGNFGYPKEEAMCIAVDEINKFLIAGNMMIYLVVFDTTATRLGLNLYPDLEAYIDHHYVCEKREEEYGDRFFGSARADEPGYAAYRRERVELEERLVHKRVREKSIMAESISEYQSSQITSEKPTCQSAAISPDTEDASITQYLHSAPITDCSNMDDDEYDDFIEEKDATLKERMKHMSDSFQEYFFYLLETKKLSHVDVYKRAIIDKRLFYKIKKNPNYHPDKSTALRLCVGAMLNLDESKDLLLRAGYALSPCDMRDIIFSYFIEQEIYDTTEIDITLEEHGLPGFIV